MDPDSLEMLDQDPQHSLKVWYPGIFLPILESLKGGLLYRMGTP